MAGQIEAPYVFAMPTTLPEYVQGKLRSDAESRVDIDSTHARLYQQLDRFSPLPAGARVLDVACGTGKWAAYLADQNLKVHCADLQAEFLELASDRARRLGRRVEAVQADASALPYLDDSFDALTLFSVLEHVSDWRALLREAVRVLAPGGTLWVTTTNVLCPFTDEIQGFPFFPWYPQAVQARVMRWVQAHRPSLIAHSPSPAMHWFTYKRLESELRALGCSESASLIDYLEPGRGGWRRPLLQQMRSRRPLRLAFELTQPGCRLLALKATAGFRPRRTEPRLARRTVGRASAASTLLGEDLQRVLACPQCKGALDVSARSPHLNCARCRLQFAVEGSLPALLVSRAVAWTPRLHAVSREPGS